MGWQADQISFPVELSLRTTPLGLRLCSLPVREIAELYANTKTFDGRQLRETDADLLEEFNGGLYDIELDADVNLSILALPRTTSKLNFPSGKS